MAEKKEPLFHVIKRTDLNFKKLLIIKSTSIILGFLFCCLFMLSISGANPIEVIAELFAGNFGTPKRIWRMLRELSLLLLVGLSLVPAFKMKYWNLGGNGQILMSCLGAIICMYYMGAAGVPNPIIIICMIIASVSLGIIWAVIPAIFKAYFNTNESLFTLMLNYIAVGLVSVFLAIAVKNGSQTLPQIQYGHLPVIGNEYVLPIIISLIMLGIMFVYLKYTKHGYELAVVGESKNTARYVGINVKKVIIRTLILSGAISGLVGLLIAGSIDFSITTNSANNLGFTAIMATWLGQFNPLYMLLTSFLITFLNRGMSQVQTTFGITSTAGSQIVLGVMYFLIIAFEFFVNYKVIFRKKEKKVDETPSNEGLTKEVK